MKRMTSIKKAYNYFKERSSWEEGIKINGETYYKCIPPKGFYRMLITYNNGITIIYEKYMWRDYSKLIEKDLEKIIRIIVYYV